MVRAKSNIGPDGGGFEYQLERVEVPGRGGLYATQVLWGSPVEGTARDLLAAVETEPVDDGERTATDNAADCAASRRLRGSWRRWSAPCVRCVILETGQTDDAAMAAHAAEHGLAIREVRRSSVFLSYVDARL